MTHDTLINLLYKHQDGFADLERRYEHLEPDFVDGVRDMYDAADFERIMWMNLGQVALHRESFATLDDALAQVKQDIAALRYIQAVPTKSESGVRPARDAFSELIRRHAWYSEQRHGLLADQLAHDNFYIKRRAAAEQFALSLLDDGYDLLPTSL